MHNIKQLLVWKKSIELSTSIYAAVANFPIDERFGLTSQIKRSVVSIASNIAEGAGRNGNKEFNQFLGIANGSAYELQTQITIAQTLNLIEETKAVKLLNEIEEIQKMIYALKRKLNA
ncbi:MAG: four helix bundle protein [Flavobacteriales bacterium]|nr:four helix bundle protein [Flavobacteriales bacterium]